MSVQLKMKLRPTAMQPVTQDTVIPDMPGIAAVQFQNVGDSTVRLFHGLYTVLPNGGILSLNVTEDFGSMDVFQLDVKFIGGTTNRLEIITLRYGADNTNINC